MIGLRSAIEGAQSKPEPSVSVEIEDDMADGASQAAGAGGSKSRTTLSDKQVTGKKKNKAALKGGKKKKITLY